MKHPVRFDGLGPSGMARRFGDADRVAPDPDRLARARAVLSEVAPQGKVGRPAKHSGKPWEGEGISRALWYRRKAGAEPPQAHRDIEWSAPEKKGPK